MGARTQQHREVEDVPKAPPAPATPDSGSMQTQPRRFPFKAPLAPDPCESYDSCGESRTRPPPTVSLPAPPEAKPPPVDRPGPPAAQREPAEQTGEASGASQAAATAAARGAALHAPAQLAQVPTPTPAIAMRVASSSASEDRIARQLGPDEGKATEMERGGEPTRQRLARRCEAVQVPLMKVLTTSRSRQCSGRSRSTESGLTSLTRSGE